MKLATQVSHVLAVRWLSMVLGFVTGIFVARSVGPEGKGILTLFFSFFSILFTFLNFGLPSSAAYLFKKGQRSIGEIFGGSALIFLVLLVLTFWLVDSNLPFFLRVFVGSSPEGTIRAEWVSLIFATLPGALLLSIAQIVWVVGGRMKLYSVANLSIQLVNISLIWIVALILRGGVGGVLMANFGAQTFGLLLIIVWLWRGGPTCRPKIHWQGIKDLLRFGWGPQAGSLVSNIFKRGEAILLALYLDLGSLGLYGVGYGFYEILTDLPKSVVWPLMGRMTEMKGSEQVTTVARYVRVQVAAMTIPVLGAMLLTPVVLPLVYGTRFSGAAWFFAFIAPAALFRTLYLGLFTYFTARGRTDLTVPGVTVAAIANLGLDVLLAPKFGLNGVVLSNMAAEILMAGTTLVFFVRESKAKPRDLFPPRLADFKQVGQIIVDAYRKYRNPKEFLR